MLTRQRITDLMRIAKEYHIQCLRVHTGHGFMIDSNGVAHMGLIGHTKASSKEALNSIRLDLENSSYVLHKHDTMDYHETGFKHLHWQIRTVHPLFFIISNTKDVLSTIFIQELAPLNPLFDLRTDAAPCFIYNTQKENIEVAYSLDLDSENVSMAMAELYWIIWAECERIYYLFCRPL